jgi:hypothetical protein
VKHSTLCINTESPPATRTIATWEALYDIQHVNVSFHLKSVFDIDIMLPNKHSTRSRRQA